MHFIKEKYRHILKFSTGDDVEKKGYGFKLHFHQYFSYFVVISFICG
jgi:hypothetical protein